MIDSIQTIFPVLAITIWISVPVYAAAVRGRLYAIFSGVLLSLTIPGALILHARWTELASASLQPALHLLFAYSMAAAGVQLAHLVRARLRSRSFRILISVPGRSTSACTRYPPNSLAPRPVG